MHPASRAISLCCSLAYSINLNGGKAVRFSLRYLLPMMAVAMLVDPAFNHEGATILPYLPSGNPLTLESIVYGLSAAAMMASVILWFSCYNAVMTSDKFVYLFGWVIPALSLVLSMALRFAPKFKAQLHTVSEAQRCVGRDDHAGLQCPVYTGAVDTVADVLYGHHRFPCGGIVPERLAAPQQGVAVRVRCVCSHRDLWRHYEPRLGAHVVGGAEHRGYLNLLSLRLPNGLHPCRGERTVLWFGAEPMLEKLDRIKVKYGLVEPG